jgi:proteasome lid subunit RPN8/RPN11
MAIQFRLTQDHCDKMLQHVAEHAPLEACGLLAGKNGRVESVLPIRNQAQSPVRFVMDPYEQLQAFDWIDSQELELIGIFHSHPAGPETVSPTDIEEAAYEVVHLIWSCTAGGIWKMRGFWIEAGRAQEVDLFVEKRGET